MLYGTYMTKSWTITGVKLDLLAGEIYQASSSLHLGLEMYGKQFENSQNGAGPNYMFSKRIRANCERAFGVYMHYTAFFMAPNTLQMLLDEGGAHPDVKEAMNRIYTDASLFQVCLQEYPNFVTSMSSFKESLAFQHRSYAMDLVEETEVNILLRDRAAINDVLQKILAGNMSKMDLAEEMSSESILKITSHLEELMSRVSSNILQPLRSYIQDSELAVKDAYTTSMQHTFNLIDFFNYFDEKNMRHLNLWRKPKLYLHETNVGNYYLNSKNELCISLFDKLNK